MKSIPVSKLKATLSECIDRVKKGEEMILTDRGIPVARLTALDASSNLISNLQHLVRDGLVRLPTRKLPKDFFDSAPKDPKGAVLKSLLDERKEDER